MKMSAVALGAAIGLMPLVSAKAQESLAPAIGADNARESRQAETGRAVTHPAKRTGTMRRMHTGVSHNTGAGRYNPAR